MGTTAKLDIKDGSRLPALRAFFRSLLEQDDIRAILIPQQPQQAGKPAPHQKTVMPELVVDPKKLERADPLSPAFFLNVARMLSRLTRKPAGGKIAAVLRPCEIRAFIELVKLKQGRTDNLILIGLDCPGACTNRDFMQITANGQDPNTAPLARACRICEDFLPTAADIGIGLLGMDAAGHIVIQAQTPAGEAVLSSLNLPEGPDLIDSDERRKAIETLKKERAGNRKKVLAETEEIVNSPQKLNAYFANCVNCYNCRVACPVCYCKECVFSTSVFDHDPLQYLQWAARKGALKMPSDTLFYHLTRMAHMSLSCVGCGQCSNACPNDIPVAELFCMVADGVRKAFDYEPGQDAAQPPPLSVFEKDEFQEVVGI